MNSLHLALIAVCLTTLFVTESRAAALAAAPVTLRTQITGDILSVPLALSYQQVVLEQRHGAGWKPIAVQYPRTLNRDQMRNVHFNLPAGVEVDDLRVQGYRSPKFPSRFTYGKRIFSRLEAGENEPMNTSLDRLQIKPKRSSPNTQAPQALEPEIWQLVEQQLFFYNQYRGLQVLDLQDPTNPLRTGSLRLPAVGEKMWILDPEGTQVALLGRSNGKGRPGAASLFLLRVEDGMPELISEFPLDGPVLDSRLIGAHLHLLSAKMEAKQGAVAVLNRVDLSDFVRPRGLNKLSFSGTDPFFQMNGEHLLVGVKMASRIRLHEVKVEAETSTRDQSLTSQDGHQVMGYAVSVSGQELRVQNVADVQDPTMKMGLGWRTDRVLPVGDFLVQIEDGNVFGRTKEDGISRLRITPNNDPDLLVQELVLGMGKVVGVSQKETQMFIAQWVPATGSKQAFLRTWVLDLNDPLHIQELGTVEQDLHGLDAWDLALNSVQALWVDAETLLWFIPAQHHTRLWWSGPMPVQPAKPAAQDLIPASSAVMVLCPVNFSKSVLSSQESQVLRIRGRVTHTSRAFTEAGFVFFSHDFSDESAVPSVMKSARVKVPLRPLPNQVHSWLQVVDYRSGDPLLRDPVSIPGQLLGLSQADAQGAVLLTQSDLSLRRNTAPIRVIQASAYDGVNAYQLDSYVTATSFHSAFATDGAQVYLAQEAGRAGVVAVGYQSVTGRLSQISTWSTNAVPAMLHVTSGHLVASSLGNLELAHAVSETGKLTPIASYDTPMNLWLQVDRSTVTATSDLWIPAGDYGVEFLQKQASGF